MAPGRNAGETRRRRRVARLVANMPRRTKQIRPITTTLRGRDRPFSLWSKVVRVGRLTAYFFFAAFLAGAFFVDFFAVAFFAAFLVAISFGSSITGVHFGNRLLPFERPERGKHRVTDL